MPCVEGDRSDCQLKANSVAAEGNGGCRGLAIWVLGQKPPGHKPPDKKPPCQKPPRGNL